MKERWEGPNRIEDAFVLEARWRIWMTLADLVYASAFSRVLNTLPTSLNNENLLPDIGSGTPHVKHTIYPVAYHDDVVAPIIADKACNLVAHTLRVTNIFCTVFKMFGLQMNFLPGKTAAIPHFAGIGTKKAMLDLQSSEYIVSSDDTHCNVFKFVFDRTYKHVGTKFSMCFGMADEVTYRSVSMRHAMKSYQHIFSNPRVPLNTKLIVVKVYLLTRGSFQCGTWPILDSTQANRFHATVLHIYRRATGNTFKVNDASGDMFSDADIVHKYELISPSAMIRNARLQLFLRILIKQPTAIIKLIHRCSTLDVGWIAAVKSDLAIVAPFFPTVCTGDFIDTIGTIVQG